LRVVSKSCLPMVAKLSGSATSSAAGKRASVWSAVTRYRFAFESNVLVVTEAVCRQRKAARTRRTPHAIWSAVTR
jgi:hypothetical protein